MLRPAGANLASPTSPPDRRSAGSDRRSHHRNADRRGSAERQRKTGAEYDVDEDAGERLRSQSAQDSRDKHAKTENNKRNFITENITAVKVRMLMHLSYHCVSINAQYNAKNRMTDLQRIKKRSEFDCHRLHYVEEDLYPFICVRSESESY